MAGVLPSSQSTHISIPGQAGQERSRSAQALRTPEPVIVACVVDPYKPPLPAKIAARQAHKMRIIASVGKDKIREMI